MPQNLPDTHTLIWYVNGDAELSPAGRTAIEASDAVTFVSIASPWEIAIKVSWGKLALNTPFHEPDKHWI